MICISPFFLVSLPAGLHDVHGTRFLQVRAYLQRATLQKHENVRPQPLYAPRLNVEKACCDGETASQLQPKLPRACYQYQTMEITPRGGGCHDVFQFGRVVEGTGARHGSKGKVQEVPSGLGPTRCKTKSQPVSAEVIPDYSFYLLKCRNTL